MTSVIRKLLYRLGGKNNSILLQGEDPEKLSRTQQQFIEWNAQRLNISLEESKQRYLTSWRAIEGGHRKKHYRRFNDLSYDLYQVFFSDKETEIFSAYAFHGPMHFLRMLSYDKSQWEEDNPIVNLLGERESVDIIDYGCGLAQQSRALAHLLQEKGVRLKLVLVDIPTLRKDFLIWLGEQNGLETVFLESRPDNPIPELPAADICFVTEFFEHVYQPLPYFRTIHAALRGNGLLVTNINDHELEFLHVSPGLAELREEVDRLGYQSIEAFRLFRKPAGG